MFIIFVVYSKLLLFSSPGWTFSRHKSWEAGGQLETSCAKRRMCEWLPGLQKDATQLLAKDFPEVLRNLQPGSLRKCTAGLGKRSRSKCLWPAGGVDDLVRQGFAWGHLSIMASFFSTAWGMRCTSGAERSSKRRDDETLPWAAGVVAGLFFRFRVLVCASNAFKRWRVCSGGRVGDCSWGWGRAQGKLGNRRVSASGFCFGLASAGGLFRVWLSGVVTHPTHSSTPRRFLLIVCLMWCYFCFIFDLFWCWGAGLFLMCVLFMPVGSECCCFFFLVLFDVKLNNSGFTLIVFFSLI